jgi:hypothetical protein
MSRDKPDRPHDLVDVLLFRADRPQPSEDEDAYALPPPARSWRAQHGGLAQALAALGVGFGFLLLIVPGILALRDVRAWTAGERFRPRLAWALGGLACWSAVVVALQFSAFGGISLVIGVMLLPIVVHVAARE